jgi:hypothetical protein
METNMPIGQMYSEPSNQSTSGNVDEQSMQLHALRNLLDGELVYSSKLIL